MAPRVGLEPTAYRLTAGCSTIELPRNTMLLSLTTTLVIIRMFKQKVKNFFIFFNYANKLTILNKIAVKKAAQTKPKSILALLVSLVMERYRK